MLLTMILTWVASGKPYYESMNEDQTIPYISDVGASPIQPVFIILGTTTVVMFDITLILDRWLRHRGYLAKATSLSQKVLAVMAILFAMIGATGLILLTIFDTLHYPRRHMLFLTVFITGYVMSAIFLCIQYHRMGAHHPDVRWLRISFWIKLMFIFPELALAITFVTLTKHHHHTEAAIIEWCIALVFCFYLLSFTVDFLPMTDTEKEKLIKRSHLTYSHGHDSSIEDQEHGHGHGQSQGPFSHGRKPKVRFWPAAFHRPSSTSPPHLPTHGIGRAHIPIQTPISFHSDPSSPTHPKGKKKWSEKWKEISLH